MIIFFLVSTVVTVHFCLNEFSHSIDKCMVTTCLEKLEMSGNLTAVREVSGEKILSEKLPKTVYCKLHICVHTRI